MRRDARPWAAAVVVAAGLLLVAVAARSDPTDFGVVQAPSRQPTTEPPTTVASATPRPTATGAAGPFADVASVYLIVYVLLTLLLLGYVLANLRSITVVFSRRRRPAAEVVPPDVEVARELTEAVDEGLREIEEGEPREAVIACWVRLERIAARAGTVRAASETSVELTARVLAGHRVTAGTLRRLNEAYREARYSSHPTDEASRREAREALEEIRRELGERPVRRAGGDG